LVLELNGSLLHLLFLGYFFKFAYDILAGDPPEIKILLWLILVSENSNKNTNIAKNISEFIKKYGV